MGLLGSSSPKGRMAVGGAILGVVALAALLLAVSGAYALYGSGGSVVLVLFAALGALGAWWYVTGKSAARGGT